MSSPAIPQGDLRERILIALRDSKKPVTLKTLAKVVKAKEETLALELESATNGGEVYRWPGRSQSFWNISPVEKARAAILHVAGIEALSKADLSNKAAKNVSGLSAKYVTPQVAVLATEKQLQAVPAFSGSAKLFVLTGRQEAYFKAARSFIEKKIVKAGFNPAEFASGGSAPKTADAAAEILEAVKSLEPVRGVPVSTLRLRNHFRDLSKREFDLAALELRKRQEVFLSQHADPYNISEEDKELLIDGQDGTYYVAIAIR